MMSFCAFYVGCSVILKPLIWTPFFWWKNTNNIIFLYSHSFYFAFLGLLIILLFVLRWLTFVFDWSVFVIFVFLTLISAVVLNKLVVYFYDSYHIVYYICLLVDVVLCRCVNLINCFCFVWLFLVWKYLTKLIELILM